MSFENMPELHSTSGHFILLSVMGAIALALLAIFRVKKWLKKHIGSEINAQRVVAALQIRLYQT